MNIRNQPAQRYSKKQERSLRELFASLDARKRPEDVAEMIMELLGTSLAPQLARVVEQAASASLKRSLLGYSSMLQDFARPRGLEKQVRKAETLFRLTSRLSAAQCTEPSAIKDFLELLSEEIQKEVGKSDFKFDRMNRSERRALGMDISKRRYNKLFRHEARMERKLAKLIRELKKREFCQIGKSSLASRLSYEAFSADIDGACFIAYYSARCNLRSEFTISGQTRAYDQIAELLYERCTASANWFAIAHVYPERAVLAKLSDTQKGELMGSWYQVLGDISQLLKEIWESSDMQRETMIVRRGNDSTTWNNTASAWNKARSAWMSLLYAMGLESVLDSICPGKVLRLMAADVVAWHYSAGGQLDPDTAVWNALPLPWEVLHGEVPCDRKMIRAVCKRYRIDAMTKGWIAAPPKGEAVPFTATPELVHGVSVSSPALASSLRKAGWFSGKVARPVVEEVAVQRDAHGFVTGAKPATMASRLREFWKQR